MTVGITSFIDGWAHLEIHGGGAAAFIGGDPRFDAFTGYPLAVGAAIAGAFLYVGLIVGRALGDSSRKGRYVDVAISLAVLVLLLYGIWEGPSGLSDAASGAAVEGSGSFAIKRGPSLFVATGAAAAMVAASAVGLHARGKTNG